MNNWFKRTTSFFRDNKARIKHVGIGRVIYDTASWFFDNPFYIGVIAWKGPLAGGAILTFLSLILCFITLLIYERMKIEWTGVDVIDDLREKGIEYADKIHNRGKHESLRQLFVRIIFFIPAKLFVLAMWLIKKFGDVAAFFVLSIFQDPFYTTAYLRHGRFDGLRRKDYSIFFLSVLVSNGYWILRNWGLIAVFLLVWRVFSHFLFTI